MQDWEAKVQGREIAECGTVENETENRAVKQIREPFSLSYQAVARQCVLKKSKRRE
jgi:hypothetical protein